MAEEENLELDELQTPAAADPQNDGITAAEEEVGRPHGARDRKSVV